MRRWDSARWLLACGVALGVSACKADIPDGTYACDTQADCPSGLTCRAEPGDTTRYCYAAAAPDGSDGGDDDRRDGGATDGGGAGSNAGKDGGAAGNNAAPSGAPTGSGFSTGGERRGAGGFVLYDDGFDRGARMCSADGTTCVTGGFSP